MRSLTALLFLFFVILTCSHPVYADRVRVIHADGTLELENGKRVRFAGIEMMPETIRLLPVLVADRELKIVTNRKEDSLRLTEPIPAYIFVKMVEMDMPITAKTRRNVKEILLNELLLSIGAARVQEDVLPKWRDDFREAEEMARETGAGVWSYGEAKLERLNAGTESN